MAAAVKSGGFITSPLLYTCMANQTEAKKNRTAHERFKLAEGGECRIYRHDDGGVTIGFESPLQTGVLHIEASVILTQSDRENLLAALR